MPGNTYTLPKLAKEVGVSASTCRRYVKNFSEFIPIEIRGRLKLYLSEAIPVLKRIKELYSAGYKTSEIGVALTKEFPGTKETTTVNDGDEDVVQIKHFIVTLKKQLKQMDAELKQMPDFSNIQYILNRLKRLEQRVEALEKKNKNQ